MIGFFTWKKRKLNKLNHASNIINTKVGPIEYCLVGAKKDPVVAVMHGAMGGYDQALLEKEELLSHGFRILAWSRPGYLRTPLSVGITFQEQANALNELLKTLNIQKVSLIAISAGGVPGLLFAQQFPQKLSALIMEVALSKKYTTTYSQRLTLVLFYNDLVFWLIDIFAKKIVKSLLKFFINLESTFNKEAKKRILAQALQDKEAMKYFFHFLETIMPPSTRKAGLNNDLLQYKQLNPIDVSHIQSPTLVIFGKYDADAKPENAYYLKNMPHVELCEIPDGFHLFWFSHNYLETETKKLSFLKKHS